MRRLRSPLLPDPETGLPQKIDLLWGLPLDVRYTLECMDVAALELAREATTHPQAMADMFPLLRPTEPLRGKAPAVYLSHVRELLARAVQAADLVPGTDAECLCALLGAATRAPLNSSGCLLADRLFRRVMPGVALQGEPPHEPWPGACDELLIDAKRATRQPWRKR